MIRFDNVTKKLGGRPILNGVSFHVKKGETFFIVGPSGVGKSVTLKHMVRLLTPDSGSVLIGGINVANAGPDELKQARDRVGYLFQGGALLAWLNVAGNVALPLVEKSDLGREEIDERVRRCLAAVGLENDGAKMPDEISGGMRKRAGLARAIVQDPEIVLYDEPTSGLDPVTARTIDDLIEEMQQQLGVTSVVVTHDLHSALAIGTRIAMLYAGRIVELSAPADFMRSGHPAVQDFLESQFITKDGRWERHLNEGKS